MCVKNGPTQAKKNMRMVMGTIGPSSTRISIYTYVWFSYSEGIAYMHILCHFLRHQLNNV